MHIRVPRHPLIALYCYAVNGAVSLGNYFGSIRNAEEVDDGSQKAYIAFIVVFLLIFVFLSGPGIYNAQFYAKTEKASRRMLQVAVGVMWILFDTPLLVIEMHISNDAGFVSAIQSICMVLRLFSWFGGFIVLWIAILEKASGWLHKRSDCDPDIVEALRQKRR